MSSVSSDSDDPAVDRCAICLTLPRRPALLDPCFHGFCLGCADGWLRISPKCPLCKVSVDGVVYDVVTPTVFRRIPIGHFTSGGRSGGYSRSPSAPASISDTPRHREVVYYLGLFCDRLPSAVSRTSTGAIADETPRAGEWEGFPMARCLASSSARVEAFVSRELEALWLGDARVTADAVRFIVKSAVESGVPGCAREVARVLPRQLMDPYSFPLRGPFPGANCPFHVFIWELARFCETRYDIPAYDTLVRYGQRTLSDILARRDQAMAELEACNVEIAAIEAELARRAS